MKRFRVAVLTTMIAAVIFAAPVPLLARATDGIVRGAGTLVSATGRGSARHASEAAVPGVFLVRTVPSGKTTVATLDALPGVSAADVRPGRNRTATVKTPRGKSDEQFLKELQDSPGVEYAEPNSIGQLASYSVPPDDPAYGSLDAFTFGGPPIFRAKSWWLRDINANSGMNIASLWSSLEGPSFPARASGSAIKVAVIDTGFHMTHPDKGSNIVAGKDELATFTGSSGITTKDSDVSPVDWSAASLADPSASTEDCIAETSHGTGVAGQIGAATNNGVGVAGMTYDSTVLIYKVQGIWTDGGWANGSTPTYYQAGSAVMLKSAIIDAVYDATDSGAKVINLSVAFPSYSQSLQDAIDYAWSHGVLVVAATGNGGTLNGVMYPAADAHVVGVGSYRVTGTGAAATYKTRSDFTDYGVGRDAAGAGANNGRLDLLAPGEGIYGLIQPGFDADGAGSVYEPGYYWWSGTSMASPAFAGMAAMVWRFAPALTADQLADVFYESAINAGSASLGYGYVNPTAAYAKLKTDYPYLLAPATLYLPPSTNSSSVPVSWSPVQGTAVSYDVFDNGVFVKNVTGTSTVLTLSEASHVVSVAPRSIYNWWDPATSKSGTVLVDSTLEPVVLSGTVTSAGTPLSGASVSVPGTATVTTAANGTYTVGGIFPGTHTVTYSKYGYASQTVSVTVAPSTTATQDIALVWIPYRNVYRFRNVRDGYYLWSADEAEKANIVANLSSTWKLEGVAYQINTSNPANQSPLWRFLNLGGGFYLYSADAAEKNNIVATLGSTWRLEGEAYRVSTTTGAPVWRFRNLKDGTYLFSADPAERATINATLRSTWLEEGTAYYLAP